MVLVENDKITVFSVIINCIKKNPKVFSLMVILSVVRGVLPTICLYLNADIIDSCIYFFKNGGVLNKIVFLLTCLTILQLYLHFYSSIFDLVNRIILKESILQINIQLVNRISLLEMYEIEKKENQKIIYRILRNPGMTELEKTHIYFIKSLEIASYIISISFAISTVNLIMFILCIILSILLIIYCFYANHKIYIKNIEANMYGLKSDYIEFEMLRNRESAAERSLFDYSNKYNDKFDSLFKKGKDIKSKNRLHYLILKKLITLSFILLIGGMIILLYYQYREQVISEGIIISLIGSLFQFQEYLSNDVYEFLSNVSQNYDYYTDVNRLLLLDQETSETVNVIEKIETIEFKNVSFKYTDKYILDNVSFKINGNEHCALVGANGEGKTTIIKLILGFYRPDKGCIYINGIPLHKIKRSRLYHCLSVIFQDYAKFNATVLENIEYGSNDEVGEVKVRELCKNFENFDFINSLENGMFTYLGKILFTGVDLSGGQWQKIMILRTLIKENSFLILDEPTAALDPFEERKIYIEYMEKIKQRGCIMITHRLASTQFMNKIIVLDKGKIDDIGNHEELMRKKGLYYEMFQSQKEWYSDGTI